MRAILLLKVEQLLCIL